MSVPSYSSWLRHRTTYRQCLPPCLKDSTSPVPTPPSKICEPSKTCTCALHRPRKLYRVFPRDFFAFHAAFFLFRAGRDGDALVNFIQITRTLITAGCTSTAAFLSVRAPCLFHWPFTGRVLPIASIATLRSCCEQPQRRILPLWPGVRDYQGASSTGDPRASHLAQTIHGHRGGASKEVQEIKLTKCSNSFHYKPRLKRPKTKPFSETSASILVRIRKKPCDQASMKDG
jgi:hypothetical protein